MVTYIAQLPFGSNLDPNPESNLESNLDSKVDGVLFEGSICSLTVL